MPWFDRVEGVGRIRVYDNGGKTVDRYTVLFDDDPDPRYDDERKPRPHGPREALVLSGAPTHPQGFSQMTDARPGPHLGRRVRLTDLPEAVREHIILRAKSG